MTRNNRNHVFSRRREIFMKKRQYIINELWLAVFINLLFVLFYACLCHPVYETSDDNAMAFFVEGAYGTRTAHLVFENIIWGKFLSLLYEILPAIKWYTVAHYAGMYCAFAAISYFMMKVGGKRAGLAGSVFLLLVLGMQSYLPFQWTRVTAIVTIGGILLLFYGIEYAVGKWERSVTIIFGIVLSIWGSMIRFPFFAVCVVLSGGIALLKMLQIVKERVENWKKRLGMYFLVFGSVGVASIAIYSVDRAYYLKDENWRYYLEYNNLRGELWDLGFPEYEKNKELYEELGISKNDAEMYRTWNMDDELLPVESLRALVAAKEEQKFSGEFIKGFIKDFGEAFLCLPLFGVFLAVSMISIVLNKKKLFLVIYEFMGLVAFELYFYWIGRFGLARMDMGLLAAGIAVIMCGITEDLQRIAFKKRWTAVLICASLFLYMPALSERVLQERTDNTQAHKFFEMLSEDKDSLYLLSVQLKPYNLCMWVYDFWEPVRKGALSNICYMGGWEFNVPVKKSLLGRYGVTNIYRDSIDNPNICLIVNEEAEIIERYIRENYNKNAYLYLLKEIDSNKFWGVRSKGMKPEGNVNGDLSQIEHGLRLKREKGKLKVSGYIYKKEANSFQQRAYLKLKNLKNGEITYKELTFSEWEGSSDCLDGKYSCVTGNYDIGADGQFEISVVLQTDGELYEISHLTEE